MKDKHVNTNTATWSKTDAEQAAWDLLAEYGLDGWTFKWDRAVRRWGQCNYRARTISCSEPLMSRNPGHFTETVRHEIAHALVGPGHGHDATWRTQARAIGADPVTCHAADEPVPARWAATCNDCGKVVAERHRLTAAARTYRHLACTRKVSEQQTVERFVADSRLSIRQETRTVRRTVGGTLTWTDGGRP